MNINDTSTYQNLLRSLGSQQPAASANDENSESNTGNKNYDTVDTDKVSVSLRAEKLSRISAEFFSGTLTSDQIPELVDRLYEDGFLSNDDYRGLGGDTQSVSAITEAAGFLSQFVMSESVDGDSEAAKSLLNVIDVINGIDQTTTPETRRKESEAYDYVANYTDLLQEAGAPEDVIDGFNNVMDVLGALDSVRKTEQSTGALTSYASVQEAYDDLFKDS
ncbi:MAG: hypothetical protein CMI02_19260 [Oceanospirillaceae bacterium]|nr:hypothetical protein [Oceanospirillaceae bacterium]MBT14168.1 hypothetical protein [Oceanospirillaceae bacterium]